MGSSTLKNRRWALGGVAPALGVGLILAALLLACERSPYRSEERDTATIYMEACLPCHGGGTSGPSLTGRKLTPEAVEKKLRWGGRGMPSFPGIRGQARRDLVDYVSRLAGG